MQPPDWSLPFEFMCDASDYAVGAVLGQRNDKRPYAIYYASRTLNDAIYRLKPYYEPYDDNEEEDVETLNIKRYLGGNPIQTKLWRSHHTQI